MGASLFLLLLMAWFGATLVYAAPAAKAASSGKVVGDPASEIQWLDWNEQSFRRARAEKRLILLDLHAVWCHWCHVMDERTYSDSRIRTEIAAHYIPIGVDQDSRPDLSNRYEDYGWPATIIFDSQGRELAKRSGFIAPEDMLALLVRLREHPVPEDTAADREVASDTDSEFLDADTREKLIIRHRKSLDLKLGGLRAGHKFLNRWSLEYALGEAARGDAESKVWARQTLTSNLALIDPAWGGAYQYSTDADWNHPHFEKISSTQANNLLLYSLAFAVFQEPPFEIAAKDVVRYLRTFLRGPGGAFYTSQDADLIKGVHSQDYFSLSDSERRAKGIPAIDRAVYSRENGFLISSLLALYSYSGEPALLADAKAAAEWLILHRTRSTGGFLHGEDAGAGPYLGDQLGMLSAFLDLYTATAERLWLERAIALGTFIESGFGARPAEGLPTIQPTSDDPLPPISNWEENLIASRLLNALFQYSGNESFRTLAQAAHRFGSTPARALARRVNSGLLLADYELQHDPLHLTVVGPKSDPDARRLFRAALSRFGLYRRIEWWDRAEGPLPRADVTYPELERSACFVCSDSRCSLPLFEPQEIAEKVELFRQRDGQRKAPAPRS